MPNVDSAIRVPKYRRHRPSGQAVVTLGGRDFYLGKWGTKASRAEYQRLVGEWLAGGGCLPSGESLTVAELTLAYWRYAKQFYRVNPRGSRGPIYRVKLAMRHLRESYGQRSSGDQPFFLACRTAGKLLGVDHTTAWRWLFLLAHDGLAVEVEKGDRARRRASRWRWVGE